MKRGLIHYLVVSILCVIISLYLISLLGCASAPKYPLYIYSNAVHEPTPDLDMEVLLPEIKIHLVGSNKQFPDGCWVGPNIPAACNLDGEIWVVGAWVPIGLGARLVDIDDALLGHEIRAILVRYRGSVMAPDASYKIEVQ